ncbi:MAG TPA: helix-turn-helix domain-containing protein [Rhodanobacteraceae bacterium]|nr:helix-turn-helix domain-containing protein [Rhodanobacteraceae bacterium]
MGATATKLEPKGRLSAADWEEAALATLAESGLSAVAVESLARRLGVTKGSFYWHFATREALIKAALERWEKSDEEIVVAQLDAIADPRERLRELFRRVSGEMPSHVIYAALMQSLDHPLVRPVMARVSQRRLDVLALAYRQAGLERREAEHRARLAYSAYTGFLQLTLQLRLPRLGHDEFEAYVDHVIATLVPA